MFNVALTKTVDIAFSVINVFVGKCEKSGREGVHGGVEKRL